MGEHGRCPFRADSVESVAGLDVRALNVRDALLLLPSRMCRPRSSSPVQRLRAVTVVEVLPDPYPTSPTPHLTILFPFSSQYEKPAAHPLHVQ